MRGMVMDYRDLAGMGALEFLAMWITMMAAMMLPTIVPMVLSHHAVALRRGQSALSTLAFVTGYMLRLKLPTFDGHLNQSNTG